MELIDVVRKLVGPISPIGESHADEKRFENLKNLNKTCRFYYWRY